MGGSILVIDDDQGMCEMLDLGLRAKGFEVAWRTRPEEALPLAAEPRFDAVVTDLRMRAVDGLELTRRVVAAAPGLPVIVITAFGSVATAVAAIRAGAYDFIVKPFELDVLALALERAVRHRGLTREVEALRRQAGAGGLAPDLLGESPAMRRLLDLLVRLEATDASVLIQGETGTGKELVARCLHRRGPRAAGPFVAVNCSAIPEALLESELFGHERGAFTDARAPRPGLFLEAHGGTLFLDEIGDLPTALQPKLLRALQERRVRPLGGSREAEFDVRLLTATNKDLEAEAAAGRFRSDLLYRIEVVKVEVPPLRARGNDVLLLAQAFLARATARSQRVLAGFSPEAAELLLGYPWPGNVRELTNCIERVAALAEGPTVEPRDLPERIQAHRGPGGAFGPEDPAAILPLAAVERRYVLQVLEALGGNKSAAAKALGLDRKTLARKLTGWSAAARPMG